MRRRGWLQVRMLLPLAMLSVLGGGSQDARPEGDEDLDLVDVEVLDPGTLAPISHLRASDFVVIDEGVEREVVLLREGADHLDVVFLLDISSSASSFNFLNPVAAAVRPIRLEDQVAVVAFASRPNVLAPFTNNPGVVDAALRALARRRQPRTRPRIYSALEAAADLFPAGKRPAGRRRIILIVTHNQELPDENLSRLAIAKLHKAGVVVHGAVVEHLDARMEVNRGRLPSPLPPTVSRTKRVARPDRHTIDSVVDATGGTLLVWDHNAIDKFIRGALTEPRVPYVLGFRGARGADGGRSIRRIRVELRGQAAKQHPEALIRHRTGYRTW